ncbi:MAG: pseudouridine synthase [Burkholderiales bacterium]
MKGMKPGVVPLERALSKLGIASRTVSRQWILDGKVKVNGVLRKDPLFPVTPERARIEIEEKPVARVARRTFLLHKPRGVVTTRSDEKGRPTVFSLIPEPGLHLIAVGRLDWASSGLLLLTNDTRLAAWLTDPGSAVGRTYLITVRGKVTEANRERLRSGLMDAGERLQSEEIILRKASGKESHLTVRLTEGKNREIRRMFSALSHEVTRLKRVAYGALELGELEPGKFRELSRTELERAFPEYKWGPGSNFAQPR